MKETERNQEIAERHEEGMSFNELSRLYKLTPQRCHQIYHQELSTSQEKGLEN